MVEELRPLALYLKELQLIDRFGVSWTEKLILVNKIEPISNTLILIN